MTWQLTGVVYLAVMAGLLLGGVWIAIALGAVGVVGLLFVNPAPSPWVIFAALVAMYLVLGCMVDALSLMLLTLPVVFPIVQTQGFDPIWFGVVLVLLLEAGLITPPVGMNLFVIQGLSNESLGTVATGSMPYVALMILLVILLAVFPSVAL